MGGKWSAWRTRGRARPSPDSNDLGLPVGDPLMAALRMLAAHHRSGTDDRLASSAEAARELCALGVEHRSLAERLEDIARWHREIAVNEGRAAIRALTKGTMPGAVWTSVDHIRTADMRDNTEIDYQPTPLPDAATITADHCVDPADITVRVLGPMEVITGGTAVMSWRTFKIRTLFQYLVLNLRPAHREVLMDLLWPGHTFNSARNNLNVCVYGLRRVLLNGGPPREFIVYRDGCYMLNPDLGWAVDRDRFRHLSADARRQVAIGQLAIAQATADRAVSLYTGSLFEGDRAAEWFLPERHSLRELYLQTLEILVGLHLDLRNDLNRARQLAERILEEDSSRESGYRLLMRCHGRLNQRDQVVRQYRLCCDTLAELGTSPTAETQGLYEELIGSGA
jgi:DNA-binding SARP family transcriptional activator